MLDLNAQDRAAALLALAERWDDLIIDFDRSADYDTHMPAHVTTAAMTALLRSFVHPDRKDDNAYFLDNDWYLLRLAVNAQRYFLATGEAFTDDEERRHYPDDMKADMLASDVNYYLFWLVTGKRPCLTCSSQRHDWMDWNFPADGVRCAIHRAERIERNNARTATFNAEVKA